MTFVAQPYEQFADDILTALTGGVIREEHRFLGAEGRYSLATPGAIPFSIKLFGQVNEAFLLFEERRDYVYDDEEETIGWLADGRLPDDHSYFYVNYYVSDAPRRLTDRNPGSVTTTLSEAFAREMAVLHKQMEMIYESAFVDLAGNSSLNHVAALLGLKRKDARFASGEVLFKRSTPAEGDITIAAGTQVATAEGQSFEVVNKRTLRRGQLSIVAPIRAQVEGPPGRVEANAIQIISRPIFGIESVINEKATFFATDKETDEAFRRRIKGTLERAGKATTKAIKFGLIEAIPEINEGNVQVSEPADVAGRVEVKIGLTPPDDLEWVRRVEEAIFETRPAGIRVTHNLPTLTLSADELQAAAWNGGNGVRSKLPIEHLDDDVLAQMPEGIVRLRVDVALKLAEQNLSIVQKENIEDEVRQKVADYIESLPMGADLIYSKMLGSITQIEEVADATLLLDANTAVPPKYGENLATDGRKATIDLQDITIGLTEETVHIRIVVRLEPNSGQPDAGAAALQEVDAKIQQAVHGIVSTTTTALSKADVQQAIGAVVRADGNFKLLEDGAVILNATYEETGRLLNNTGTVDLASNQVARVEAVDVGIQGELDG